MTRSFKIKLWIIAFAVLAFLASVVGFFSVSYAKWTGGVNSVSANVSTGKWVIKNVTNIIKGEVGKQPATNTVKELYDALPEDVRGDYELPVGEKPATQIGGVIASDGNVLAAAWVNKGTKPFGYTLPRLYLNAGDTFIVSAFNRIVDPNNTGLNERSDGFAVLEGDAFGNSGYLTFGEGTLLEEKVVFHVQKSGYYSIDVHENMDTFWYGARKDNQYVVTINYSET